MVEKCKIKSFLVHTHGQLHMKIAKDKINIFELSRQQTFSFTLDLRP